MAHFDTLIWPTPDLIFYVISDTPQTYKQVWLRETKPTKPTTGRTDAVGGRRQARGLGRSPILRMVPLPCAVAVLVLFPPFHGAAKAERLCARLDDMRPIRDPVQQGLA